MLKKNLVLFLLLNQLWLQAQEKWTLEECITYALENNLEIKQSQALLNISENNYMQSRAELLPGVGADANYAVNYGRSIDPTLYEFVNERIRTSSVSLASDLTLFHGLRKINSIKKNHYEVLANKAETQDVADNIALAITQAYLEILLNAEELKRAEERLKLSSEQFQQTEKLVSAGIVPEGNLYDVQAQQAADSFSYIVATNGIELSRLNLALLLQLPDPDNFEVEIPEIEVTAPVTITENSPATIFNTALGNQPAIRRAHFSASSSEKAWAAAKGFYYPSLSVFYLLRTNYSSFSFLGDPDPFFTQYRDNLNHTIGISLEVPILNGLQTRTNVKNAQLQFVIAQYNSKGAEDQLKNEVYSAYADAKASYQRFLAAKNSTQALEKSLEYVTKRFNLGAATNLEFSTASANLIIAQNELIQSKYEYLFKLKVLDYYMGNKIAL